MCANTRHGEWTRSDPGKKWIKAYDKVYNQTPERKQKHHVRMFTTTAIALGILVRQACEMCGVKETEAHHTDYSKPLEVRWLCRTHHAAHHAKERDRA